MDEFLALMEDGGGSMIPAPDHEIDLDDYFLEPCESPADTSQSDSTTTASATGTSRPSHSHARYSTEHDSSGDKKKSTRDHHLQNMNLNTSSSSAKVATVGVDEKLGIRMMNRQVSSLDLLDLITTTSPYYSPAQIGAMSLQGLCRLLLDPPPSIIDPATVQGRTNLVTVGIVFENSGTKTSSKGGAFCILKIGSNLQTGPCLSVFLFGSVYTKFCRSCQAGQVVAVCNPKLLPSRMDDKSRQDTSVSLSVHDQSQLIHVAKARDYGVCQGKTRGKTADGSWSDSAGHCKHYVDKRVGDFCAFHSKQQKQQQHLQQQLASNRVANYSQMRAMGGVTGNGSQGFKMIQQFKAQKQPQPLQGRGNTPTLNQNRFLGSGLMPSRGNIVTTTMIAASTHPSKPVSQPNRFLDKTSTNKTPTVASTTNTSNPYLAKTTRNANVPTEVNPNASVRGIVSAIPMHMKKQDSKAIRRDLPISTASSRSDPSSKNNTGDWMREAASQRKTPSHSLTTYIAAGADRQRTRKISTIGGGFDGSVVVPKPSQLFTKNARIMSDRLPSLETTKAQVDDTAADRIKEQQSLLAAKLRERQSGSSGLDDTSKNDRGGWSSQAKVGTAKKPTATGNSFLDSIQVDNVEAVLAAKSQFASEADAEDYVRNRSRVIELEKLETKQNKRQGPSQQKENQKIICEWVCRTCPNAPRFAKRPTQCISLGHQVKRDRMLKQGKTKEEERAQLNEKAPENGGMILGRGLEWSFNRFNQ